MPLPPRTAEIPSNTSVLPLVFKSLTIGSRIIQLTVSKFCADRQYIIDTEFKRNIRFAAETQVFQTALEQKSSLYSCLQDHRPNLQASGC